MAGDVGSRARNKFEERGLDKGGQVLSRGSRKGIVGNSRERFLFSSQAGYGFNGSIDRTISGRNTFPMKSSKLENLRCEYLSQACIFAAKFQSFCFKQSCFKHLRIFILF